MIDQVKIHDIWLEVDYDYDPPDEGGPEEMPSGNEIELMAVMLSGQNILPMLSAEACELIEVELRKVLKAPSAALGGE